MNQLTGLPPSEALHPHGADRSLFDPEVDCTWVEEDLISMSYNKPFQGQQLTVSLGKVLISAMVFHYHLGRQGRSMSPW